VLAHYYARSRDLPKAMEYLERAGDKAAALDARKQAAELWRRARKMANRLGDRTAEERIGQGLSALGA
jgi:hypothetical protein